jgi:hypothetical protein
LSAADASVAGTAARFRAHEAEGAVQAGPATIAGEAISNSDLDAIGALTAGSAIVAGYAAVISPRAFAVWELVLSNGLTARENLSEAHTNARELYRLHGLEVGVPLVTTATSRTAGVISQTITEASGTVTVERI